MENEMKLRLVAVEAYGRKSPVPVLSNLFRVEVISEKGGLLNTGDKLFCEIGICIVDGAIQAFEHHIEKGNMLVAKAQDSCALTLEPNTHLLLFGGDPFPEERYIDWNFVSSDKERIEKAKAAWRSKTFPMAENDSSHIPYPSFRK